MSVTIEFQNALVVRAAATCVHCMLPCSVKRWSYVYGVWRISKVPNRASLKSTKRLSLGTGLAVLKLPFLHCDLSHHRSH